MDNKEKHIRENDQHKHHDHSHDDPRSEMIADSLRAEGKNNKRRSTKRINNLWLWLGVLVLVLIILWWLFSFGTFEDLTGAVNGGN